MPFTYHGEHRDHGVFFFVFSVYFARPGAAGRAGVHSVVKISQAYTFRYSCRYEINKKQIVADARYLLIIGITLVAYPKRFLIYA
jgi:hypothetical protein